MARLLLADDNDEVRVMLSSWLKLKDRHTVDTTEDGTGAWEFLRSYAYDVVILDWDMPGIDGIQLCKQFRSVNNVTPVVMLTGRDTTEDKINGLDAGADDYLTKPFSAEELSARIRSLLRRKPVETHGVLQSGDLLVDTIGRVVSVHGESVLLSPTEFDLLVFFVQNTGRKFAAEAVLAKVWGVDQEVSSGALRTTIKRLRRKLDERFGTCPLDYVRGEGYGWMA